MTHPLQVAAAAAAITLLFVPATRAQSAGTAARIVLWQPDIGRERDFEEGYKRHLEWHRSNNDHWTWLGWNIISGDRTDQFMDGTFFHAWTDFDAPVSPGGDAANNALNVEPYARVRSVGSYEIVPSLTALTPDQMTSPLLTLCYVSAHDGAAFESTLGAALKRMTAAMPHAVLRPINGVTEYLVIVPGVKASDAPAHAAFLTSVLGTTPCQRTETALHRADMSYLPR